MITPQQIREEEEAKKKLGIAKTIELPIGGSMFYFDIPDNPMVYVSEISGIIYINGSSYWEPELLMLKDLTKEFVNQTIELAKVISKTVSKIDDIQLGLDEKKNIEKRKFYVLIGDIIEIGFYYNLYLPDGKRNGIVEIIPYYKQYK
ncbi:hypothetical protein SULI_13210 [Saccharolobus solfataricus]|uniref:Uncharacterized protein n=3 Tax=Saccharolobus solfataricus TaxID=2287 RepID=Q97XH6_SACS2|nr:hypothetical protein [Saccharolobus solfataricus]AAK41958.1 Hypothetical protein SSO1765 [Saccharolobus solfataricus P2]AKA74705.1 hypothetical protein SULB_2599 [Saccharolobus solfataricus]AKA77399.1 hypothetical protein SULC_2595 [Saccharolobus solfataricus]AKA80091.1 hypothetical protein SULA_2598 [Saccharolobus solfataricus]AZF69169.1 hypothetical protein SULG_13210 [Saccharolobus solfataricus]